jgi:predicted thioesterase
MFSKGDRKVYKKTVTEDDVVLFPGGRLHAVYSTFALGRDFEWSSRLFVNDMLEDDEEGVGTALHINHKSPAFPGEEVEITATVEKIEKNELVCTIEARVGERLIADGFTGQKVLKKERLKALFTKP